MAEPNQLTSTLFDEQFAAYSAFPITYQIDWAVAGLTADEGQAIADEVRGKLQQFTGMIGLNKHIPRLFMGNQAQ